MINMQLIWLGQAYPFEFTYVKWLPIVFYGLVVMIGIVSVVYGRLFCGWVCPHNTLTEWTKPFRAVFNLEPMPLAWQRVFNQYPALRHIFNIISLPIGIFICWQLTVILSAYIVPWAWIQAQYSEGQPHIALLSGHIIYTLISLFLLYTGHEFCRNVCPYGMAQSVSAYQEGKWKPMEIAFTGESIENDCKTCTACQTACIVNIDPRKSENLVVGQFYGCFNCGECIDACKQVHVKKTDGAGLLKFELPWERKFERKKKRG